jgi:hypothetical protein
MVVKSELDNLNLHYTSVELGVVTIEETLTVLQIEMLKAGLWKSGLELMDDRRSQIIEKIKNVVVE